MVKPIVKWAGGKSSLMPELLSRVPETMRTYAEPFSGGAALFFALAQRRDPKTTAAQRRHFEHAILCDQNQDLIACYRAVQNEVEALIDRLGAYKNDRDLFYETRAVDTSKLSDVERGARLLFLNKTCYNGLWRVNSKGKFNVPFGKYKNPKILDADRLRAASEALAGVELRLGDFGSVTSKLGQGDFVYLDPPYAPASKTANFTAYSTVFGYPEQERLAHELASLKKRGAWAMLSNADTPAMRDLYKDFAVHVVQAPRMINSDGTKRGTTPELLVTTWQPAGLYDPNAPAVEAPRPKAKTMTRTTGTSSPRSRRGTAV